MEGFSRAVAAEAAHGQPVHATAERTSGDVKGLRLLFNLHGLVTGAAGVVLFIAPGAIPGAVGVAVTDQARLLPFMLGAAELAIAVLSFGGGRLTGWPGVRLLVVVLVTFHLTTAIAEVYALALGGVSRLIWVNVVVRVVVAALFIPVGLRAREGLERGAGRG